MKPYGVPRTLDIESPDCADLFGYALKGSRGRLDAKSSVRNSDAKRNTRRIYKRRARLENRRVCQHELAMVRNASIHFSHSLLHLAHMYDMEEQPDF